MSSATTGREPQSVAEPAVRETVAAERRRLQSQAHAPAFGGGDAKQEAVLRSVLAASGMTLLKLITGISTGSLGMLSEAVHSGIDLAASGLTLFSLRVSDKPADAEHSYGHGRFESMSAFTETLFMLGSSIFIVVKAVHRMRWIAKGLPVELNLSVWPVLVLLLSIAVDYTRSRQLARVARDAHSQALEAEALHFGTDIWSSAAVLAGVAATFAGQHYGIRQLQYADPVAAILVACVILSITWRLARETLDSLLDATPSGIREEMIREVGRMEGVAAVQRLRMRRSGTKYFADITLSMPRSLTFQRSEELGSMATQTIQRILPGTDVVVRTVPVAAGQESVFDRVRAVAARANLGIHDVSVKEMEDGLHVELHLELASHLPLREAHETVTRIESEMRRDVPEIRTVLTHIESEESTIARPSPAEDADALDKQLRRVAQAWPEVQDIHNVMATRVGDRLEMSCHASLADTLEMGEVHRIITELEAAFLRVRPDVSRLLIHPEPSTDNRR